MTPAPPPCSNPELCSLLNEAKHRPATGSKTWEACHEHFTCPNGEECWYLGADYNELQKEIGESMDYIDWDSIEAVYIRMREKKV
jgi:hypothetical protein